VSWSHAPQSNNAVSSGIVMITSSRGTCLGTLLQNDVVLTARHCVTTDDTVSGTIDIAHNFTVHMGSQSQTVGEIFAPSVDVALLILPGFLLTSSGGTLPWGWHQSIYPGSDASLQNASVLCMGYGRGTFNGVSGTLRSATQTLDDATSDAGKLIEKRVAKGRATAPPVIGRFVLEFGYGLVE
jgi:hypothetical protein